MSPDDFDEIDMATALDAIIVYQEQEHQKELMMWKAMRWQTALLMNSTGNYRQLVREKDLLVLPGDKEAKRASKSADELMGALLGYAKKVGKEIKDE